MTDIKLKCNLCKYAWPSEKLWLRTIGNRDYLVCKRHLKPQQRKQIKGK